MHSWRPANIAIKVATSEILTGVLHSEEIAILQQRLAVDAVIYTNVKT